MKTFRLTITHGEDCRVRHVRARDAEHALEQGRAITATFPLDALLSMLIGATTWGVIAEELPQLNYHLTGTKCR